MLDYDLEAERYDETRGGLPRARAAARAVRDLVGGFAAGGTLLDIACGTGLVTREFAGPGRRVIGVDASIGMARIAAARVTGEARQEGGAGAVVLGDGCGLPVRDRCVDAVTTIWLLHLLDDARPVIAEAARVLRPGGVFVTTVDKRAAHGPGGRAEPSDRAERVIAEAAERGLRMSGESAFVGHGQGRSGGPDPVFRLLAFTREAGDRAGQAAGNVPRTSMQS